MSVDSLSVGIWLLSGLMGLCIGSFVNVVICRLPIMLEYRWQGQASLEPSADHPGTFNLLSPASCCPRCQARIAWHDNLPLLGWLKRGGRCAHCEAPISCQYPLIELGSGLLTLAAVASCGLALQTLFIGGACLTLLALAIIDIRTQLLPDILTLPLLWAGLLYQLLLHPAALSDAVAGAMAGYLILWSLYWLFKLMTGKEGMGYGDFKLLAALGAWLGWQFLPMLLIFSAAAGTVAGLFIQRLMPELRGKPLPFGPWLAVAGWTALLVGDPVTTFSMRIMF